MKVVTVIGARPQFVKAAAVSAVLRTKHTELIVHTGQHYDPQMSDIFFEELGIPPADFYLGVGSKQHGEQTGEMLAGVERILLGEKPDWVLVYGDTNSTLAGALAAAKLHIPVAHVEAGLRSYNKRMPEEVNRVLTDHISSLLFCPTDQAVKNLALEGITRGVVRTGDVMCDAFRLSAARAKERNVGKRYQLAPNSYLLATIHRAENTDDISRMKQIFQAFARIPAKIILPLHPRTRKVLNDSNVTVSDNVQILEPVGYLDMVWLLQRTALVLTDSGGVQKEAYLSKVPCITLRNETEWVETVEAGWNVLTGTDRDKILAAVAHYQNHPRPDYIENLYGDGRASQEILAAMEESGP